MEPQEKHSTPRTVFAVLAVLFIHFMLLVAFSMMTAKPLTSKAPELRRKVSLKRVEKTKKQDKPLVAMPKTPSKKPKEIDVYSDRDFSAKERTQTVPKPTKANNSATANKKTTAKPSPNNAPKKYRFDPSPQQVQQWLDKANPQASSFIPEYSFGENLGINSASMTYASFFLRMKQSIGRAWVINERITQRHAPIIESAFRMILDRKGTLLSLEQIRSSGYPSLDATAQRALRDAAPYVDPPSAMFQGSDRFVLNWGMVIYTRPPG